MNSSILHFVQSRLILTFQFPSHKLLLLTLLNVFKIHPNNQLTDKHMISLPLFRSYLPTNSANSAFGNRCFFDDNSFIPNVYLNPAIFCQIVLLFCLKRDRKKEEKTNLDVFDSYETSYSLAIQIDRFDSFSVASLSISLAHLVALCFVSSSFNRILHKLYKSFI